MSHHSFVDDIPQEAEMEEIENNDIKSYFISTSDTYIYTHKIAHLDHRTPIQQYTSIKILDVFIHIYHHHNINII